MADDDDDGPDWSFDFETYLLFPAFVIGTGASLGTLSADFVPFIDLGQIIFETGNAAWSIGRVIAILSLFAVLWNRDASLKETKGLDVWVAYATIGIMIAPPFFPALESTIAEGGAAVWSWLVTSIGFTAVSYIN